MLFCNFLGNIQSKFAGFKIFLHVLHKPDLRSGMKKLYLVSKLDMKIWLLSGSSSKHGRLPPTHSVSTIRQERNKEILLEPC